MKSQETIETPFLPPTIEPASLNDSTGSLTATPQPVQPTPNQDCSNQLSFIQDVTIPDQSQVTASSQMDKQWLVQNSGTCNWTSIYRIKLVSGDPMGAQSEQALYPAKAGSQAIIRILFTAPVETGHFTSSWQAFTSQGEVFGDPVFIDINVVGPP